MTSTIDLDAAPVAPARTYGTFRHLTSEQAKASLSPDDQRVITRGGLWSISAEPAVAMRVKRAFGRVRASRTGAVIIGHTIEVARDLEWFMTRFPLLPHDQHSEAMLTVSAAAHVEREAAIATITSGTYQPPLALVSEHVKARDYQQAAVDLLRRTGGLLLVDALGLGKTTTALLNCLHNDALPAVVVAPTHLAAKRAGRWVEELDEHFPHLRFHVARKGTPYPLADKRTGQMPDVLILSYTKLDGWSEFLAGWARYVIFEEVHELRAGQETVKGRAAARLASAVPYRLGLTATPVYNYAGESWHILDTLMPDALGSKEEFQREWASRVFNGHMQVGDSGALGSYLREQGLMLGRTRTEVGRELPKTIKVTHTVDADAAELEKVQGDVAALARVILGHVDAETRFDRFRMSGELDMMMRQATGLAKAPYVAEFCRMLLESEEKIVLFGWHRAVYDVWLERLGEFNPVLYTGTESPNQKGLALERFKRGDSRILIMSLRSGSGVDGLQMHTKVAVFGELDWSPQVHEQGIGRLRRDGITEPPVAYFLVSDEGSDPAIAQVLQIKRQQGEPLVSKDGALFNNAVADVNRTRLLAEAALARAASRSVAAGA